MAAWPAGRSINRAFGNNFANKRPAGGGTIGSFGAVKTIAGIAIRDSSARRSSRVIKRNRCPYALMGTSAVFSHQVSNSTGGVSGGKKNRARSGRLQVTTGRDGSRRPSPARSWINGRRGKYAKVLTRTSCFTRSGRSSASWRATPPPNDSDSTMPPSGSSWLAPRATSSAYVFGRSCG